MKLWKTILIPTLSLFVICLVVAGALAGSNAITARKIEELNRRNTEALMKQVLPAEAYEEVSAEGGTVYRASSGGAAAGGDVFIRNVIPKHLDCITAKLEEMGVQVEEYGDAVRVIRRGPLRRTNIQTMPYPGFPTDMQPQIAACLCLANGTSVINEGIWENRYRYVAEFRRLGAHIQVDGKIAVIEGVDRLTGAPLCACDLRAGAAMVIAGLAAEGTTEISCIHYIERGYENLVEKLRGIGADIRLVDTQDEDGQRAGQAG